MGITNKAISTKFLNIIRTNHGQTEIVMQYAIFLMMRLKSFRPDIDKKIGSPGENAKNKKKSLQ
jgi:hypothetical protein